MSKDRTASFPAATSAKSASVLVETKAALPASPHDQGMKSHHDILNHFMMTCQDVCEDRANDMVKSTVDWGRINDHFSAACGAAFRDLNGSFVKLGQEIIACQSPDGLKGLGVDSGSLLARTTATTIDAYVTVWLEISEMALSVWQRAVSGNARLISTVADYRATT